MELEIWGRLAPQVQLEIQFTRGCKVKVCKNLSGQHPLRAEI